MYSPGYGAAVLPMVSSFTKGGAFDEVTVGTPPSSATWEQIDRAVYTPVPVAAGCVVRRVWWANGATTTGGATIEVGIYADSGYGPGAKLVSGSATQGTASQVQFVDVTDTALPPGLYWIAVTTSATTNTTLFRSGAGSVGLDAALRFQQSSARPLPATATPEETTSTLSQLWLCGFATTASP